MLVKIQKSQKISPKILCQQSSFSSTCLSGRQGRCNEISAGTTKNAGAAQQMTRKRHNGIVFKCFYINFASMLKPLEILKVANQTTVDSSLDLLYEKEQSI